MIRDPLQPYRACSEIFTVVPPQTGHRALRIDAGEINAGFGHIRDSAIECMSRDARVQSIGGGATEVILEEIAKRSVVGG
ncbi:MAG: acyl-CoA dehydrogenase family protein [Porticoccaceae bacterium]